MQCVWPITTFLFWQCDKRHTSKGTVKAERRSKYVVIYSLVRLNVSTTGSSSIDIASFFEMFKGHNKTSVPTKRHICQSTCNQENEILTRSTTCPLYTSRYILACWINFKPGAWWVKFNVRWWYNRLYGLSWQHACNFNVTMCVVRVSYFVIELYGGPQSFDYGYMQQPGNENRYK